MIRYMGTKRHMVAVVRDALESVGNRGAILDLFAGTGSVAESFADRRPAVLNDAFEFISCIARARFTEPPQRTRWSWDAMNDRVTQASISLVSAFGEQFEEERRAVAGSDDRLARYMSRAKHVGNSSALRARAAAASTASGVERYSMVSLYFSAGYLSLGQAIEADALRYAIDALDDASDRDEALAAWLVAVSRCLNAPGHTAQFIKANTASGAARVRRAWRMSISEEFEACWQTPGWKVGSSSWRAGNTVRTSDALALLRNPTNFEGVGAIYADPPYTRDQYGRFYHLYETLYRYDFPAATGAGRVRGEVFHTGFSQKTRVHASFRQLMELCRGGGIPLVLSYPSNGLLSSVGQDAGTLAGQIFSEVSVQSIDAAHSTMGGSKGLSSRKPVVEQLVVCRP